MFIDVYYHTVFEFKIAYHSNGSATEIQGGNCKVETNHVDTKYDTDFMIFERANVVNSKLGRQRCLRTDLR